MESAVIEQLLEKYFEGETTLAEEQQLKAYFSSGSVPEHLQEYQPMFAFFKQERAQGSAAAMFVQAPQKNSMRYVYAAAAALVLCLGLGYWLMPPTTSQSKTTVYGTYDDPDQAFEATQKALGMLSEQVNVGVNSMQYLEKYEQTKDNIFITE